MTAMRHRRADKHRGWIARIATRRNDHPPLTPTGQPTLAPCPGPGVGRQGEVPAGAGAVLVSVRRPPMRLGLKMTAWFARAAAGPVVRWR